MKVVRENRRDEMEGNKYKKVVNFLLEVCKLEYVGIIFLKCWK